MFVELVMDTPTQLHPTAKLLSGVKSGFVYTLVLGLGPILSMECIYVFLLFWNAMVDNFLELNYSKCDLQLSELCRSRNCNVYKVMLCKDHC